MVTGRCARDPVQTELTLRPRRWHRLRVAGYNVVEAHYVRDYVLWLRFRDGTAGEIDLSPVLRGPMFEALKVPEYFRQFFVHPDCATIAWPNGADIAPEYLHDHVRVAETPTRGEARYADSASTRRETEQSSALSGGITVAAADGVPRISAFFGITIYMYFTEHGRPHFHATYGGDDASVDIETGEFRGDLPVTAKRLVREWLILHRSELLANWERARQQLPLVAIEPLN